MDGGYFERIELSGEWVSYQCRLFLFPILVVDLGFDNSLCLLMVVSLGY